MPANNPEEICRLFKQFMADSDISSLLRLYDDEAVFLTESGDTVKGPEDLREVLTPLAAARPVFDFNIGSLFKAETSP